MSILIDLNSGGLGDWASLPKDILGLIAEHFDFFEDFFTFFLVCKSWQSVSSICKKSRPTFPPRCPWIMLTDISEKNFRKATWEDDDATLLLVSEIEKNEHIEGMNKRRFFSLSRSKTYEFELPEATRKKCLGVGNGWLMTVGYDLQINLLHPFSRQQVGMPPLSSFKYLEDDCLSKKPQEVFSYFVHKAVMSCNPYNSSSNEECIIVAIYARIHILAFARPGDKVWTVTNPPYKFYRDVIYYKGKIYAIDREGVVVVCDIHDVKRPTVTPIACIPYRLDCKDSYRWNSKYLVESSGSLLVVVRLRNGPDFSHYIRSGEYVDHVVHDIDIDVHGEGLVHYTFGFCIFKLEECHGDRTSIDAYPFKFEEFTHGDRISDSFCYPANLIFLETSDEYPFKLIPVNNLGDNALFLGDNASVSLPASSDNNVKGNHIYFSDDETINYRHQPYGGGHDTGIYDVETGKITWHYASNFMSRLTPPMWYI